MMSREAASCSIEYCSHVILARSKVSCACIVGTCANRNKAPVRSSRSFTVTSIGSQGLVGRAGYSFHQNRQENIAADQRLPHPKVAHCGGRINQLELAGVTGLDRWIRSPMSAFGQK